MSFGGGVPAGGIERLRPRPGGEDSCGRDGSYVGRQGADRLGRNQCVPLRGLRRYREPHIEITYPNGAVYRQEARDGFSTGTGSSGTEGFADPYAMCELIADSVPKPAIDRLGGGLLILLGLVGLLSPKTAWQLEYGWRYQNAEPSSLALGLNRAAGVLGIAIVMVRELAVNT